MLKLVRSLALCVCALLAFGAFAGNPPSSKDQVIDKTSAPAQERVELWTNTVATTLPPTVVFADLGPGKFGEEAIAQNVTIRSHPDNDGSICVLAVPIPLPVVGATNTCAEVCAADAFSSVMTCDLSTTDGTWIEPSETLPHLDTGAFCYCARAAPAATVSVVQARRVAR